MICKNYIDRACKINSLFYLIKYHQFLQMDLYKRYNKSLLLILAEGFLLQVSHRGTLAVLNNSICCFEIAGKNLTVPRWDTCHIKITACDTVTVFTTQIID